MLLKKGLLSASSQNGGTSFFRAQEIPVGVKDGVNKIFTIPQTPIANSLIFIYNGDAQTRGIDYNYTGRTIQMEIAPTPQDNLLAIYNYI